MPSIGNPLQVQGNLQPPKEKKMDHYIDGFVIPISRDHVDDYKKVAQAVAAIYKEHGAIEYLEFIGDDMERKCTRPFPEVVSATEDEVVVFGWAVFESREARDLINAKVEVDPRMGPLVAPLLDPANLIFNSERMAYGGFRSLVGPGSEP